MPTGGYYTVFYYHLTQNWQNEALDEKLEYHKTLSVARQRELITSIHTEVMVSLLIECDINLLLIGSNETIQILFLQTFHSSNRANNLSRFQLIRRDGYCYKNNYFFPSKYSSHYFFISDTIIFQA